MTSNDPSCIVDGDQLLNILSSHYPYLMVDRVVLTKRQATGTKNMTMDRIVFMKHGYV